MKDAILILGASSGIARAIADELARGGHDLILAGRDREELERSAGDLRVRHGRDAAEIEFDGLDFESHRDLLERCAVLSSGGLGGVVLCYGYLAPQEAAQKDWSEARRIVDVNYTSAVSVLGEAGNYFEAQRRGFICALSSVAGDRGRQSNYIYGSAKAGLSVFLQGLRNRLAHSGVNVITVKPGFVDTAMTWGMPGLFLVASPQRVAVDVRRAIEKGKAEIYTPWFWRWIMLIIKCIPERVFKKMKL